MFTKRAFTEKTFFLIIYSQTQTNGQDLESLEHNESTRRLQIKGV